MRPSSASVASTSAEKREISPDICSWRCARVSASLRTVRLSSSLLRMARWNTAIERASAPISSLRSLNGTAIETSPAATASVTRVISAIGLATLREITSAPAAASMTAKPASRLSHRAVLSMAVVISP